MGEGAPDAAGTAPPALPALVILHLDRQGRRLDPVAADAMADPAQALTLVVVQPGDADARAWLEQASDLPLFAREALADPTTRPRCTPFSEGMLVVLRAVNLRPGPEPEELLGLTLWLEPHRVAIAWDRPVLALSDLLAAIERGRGPTSPGDLVARLALRLADRTEPAVEELNDSVDRLEEAIAQAGAMDRAARRRLADLRHDAIVLRRFAAPQRDVLSTLAIEDLAWISDRDVARLREAELRTNRLLDELAAVHDRAVVLQEQVVDERAERMSRQSLLFTIVASIFLPLNLVTGLMGMNVGGIPGADASHGFLWTGLVILGLAGLQLALFRWLRLF